MPENREYKRSALIVIAFLLSYYKVFADVKLPSVISDNMVLQQNTKVALWGWADPGEKISVGNSWSKEIANTVADEKGEWILHLKTIMYGGPYTITIKAKNSITLNNVLLGEVWLCSGQSNMEFSLEKQQSWMTGVLNAEQEIKQADFPAMRLFTVKRNTSGAPLQDLGGNWSVCSPSNVGKFSAVAYYFGKEIMKATGIPIGLIHSSWGGTPAESWTSNETLTSDTDFKPIFERFQKAIDDSITGKKIYEDQWVQWKNDSAMAKQKGDTLKAAPKKPAAIKYYQAPSQLYNAMIHPLVPYTLKGVIWYQGEANAGRAYQYRKLFPALINSWRKEWKNDFPFYFVQIAPYRAQNPEIREAQLFTYKTVSKTGIVVITDAGDSADIHPRNKEIVGRRLSLWALAKDYGKKELIYSGPVYNSMQTEGDKIRVTFDFAKYGLVATNGSLTEFTIAGTDKKVVQAQAVIEGNTIVVWSNDVKQPVAVRFGWKNVPKAELYNKAGLPASPFRTDDWPGETFGKN